MFLLICIYWIFKCINIFYISRVTNQEVVAINSPAAPDNELDASKVKKRLKSLDIFRGISIVLMIFVNSGGGNAAI